jgi:hypothetical protein
MPDEQNPSRYRVHAALTALKYMRNGRSTFLTVPRGSVITIKSKRSEFEVVEIDWEGTALVVFNRDIDERTEGVLVINVDTRSGAAPGSRAV